jgi:hypothetical protein
LPILHLPEFVEKCHGRVIGRLALAVLLTGAVFFSGCAGAPPPVPRSEVAADPDPEPLTAGIKPLTVEQEEQIEQ